MELSFLNIFFFLASFLIFLNLISSSRNSETLSNRQLPPGNTGLPFVGETLHFSLMGKRGTSEKFVMDRMKKYADKVFKTSLLGEKMAVFCGVSGHKFLFSNEHKLVVVSWPSTVKKVFPYAETSLSAVDHATTRYRRILNGVFSPNALQTCSGIIDVVAKEHLKNHWEAQKKVNVLSLAKKYTFAVSCKLFLNIDDLSCVKDFSEKLEMVLSGILSIPINFPGTSCHRGIKASNSVRNIFSGIIRPKRDDDLKSSCDPDYLAGLLTATDDNGKLITELEITDHILASFVGSRDSIISVITCTIKYLAEYPQFYDQVLKEQRSIAEGKPPGELLNWKDLQKMKYTWNVVSEVMRLTPPAQGGFRDALCDFSYANFFIPKGLKLYWSPNTTHRNAEYFPEPEKFDPSRFETTRPVPYAYVPFGGGPRICPGKDIARLIILIFFYNLVGKFRWEKVIPNEKIVALPIPFPEKGLPIHLYPN